MTANTFDGCYVEPRLNALTHAIDRVIGDIIAAERRAEELKADLAQLGIVLEKHPIGYGWRFPQREND